MNKTAVTVLHTHAIHTYSLYDVTLQTFSKDGTVTEVPISAPSPLDQSLKAEPNMIREYHNYTV